MIFNHERHEKHEMDTSDHFPCAGQMGWDQFPDVTKLIMDFYPIEFDGFRLAKGVEIDPFGNERQNEPADFNYGESATITRMVQS